MSATYNNSGDNRDSLNVQGSKFQNFGQAAGTIINTSAGNTRPPLAHTKNLKYRADRVEQERRIYDSLVSHFQTSARRPIVFVAHGAASQCLDSFSQRLMDHMLPRYLKILVGSDQSKWHDIRWPTAARRPVANREREYKEMLTLKLEIPSDVDSTAIIDRIANNQCPMLLSSVHTEVEGDDEEIT